MNLKRWFDDRDITFEGHDSVEFGLRALESAYNIMREEDDNDNASAGKPCSDG
jgi:hypothetical protein